MYRGKFEEVLITVLVTISIWCVSSSHRALLSWCVGLTVLLIIMEKHLKLGDDNPLKSFEVLFLETS